MAAQRKMKCYAIVKAENPKNSSSLGLDARNRNNALNKKIKGTQNLER